MRAQAKKQGTMGNYELSQARRKAAQDAKYNMYMQKRSGVQSVKQQLRDDIARKEYFMNEDEANKAQ